jgi:hypothetical protein
MTSCPPHVLIMKFSGQMEKKMETYHNVKLFDTDLDRTSLPGRDSIKIHQVKN